MGSIFTISAEILHVRTSIPTCVAQHCLSGDTRFHDYLLVYDWRNRSGALKIARTRPINSIGTTPVISTNSVAGATVTSWRISRSEAAFSRWSHNCRIGCRKSAGTGEGVGDVRGWKMWNEIAHSDVGGMEISRCMVICMSAYKMRFNLTYVDERNRRMAL